MSVLAEVTAVTLGNTLSVREVAERLHLSERSVYNLKYRRGFRTLPGRGGRSMQFYREDIERERERLEVKIHAKVCPGSRCSARGQPQPLANFATVRRHGRPEKCAYCRECERRRKYQARRRKMAKRGVRSGMRYLEAAPLSIWLQTLGEPAEIARMSGLPERTLRAVMRAERKRVQFDTADRICLELGTPLDAIYPED